MTKTRRKHGALVTPWDKPPLKAAPLPCDESARNELPVEASDDVCIRFHGFYLFDPRSNTSDDFRQFLWTGLRVLRSEIKLLGFSEPEFRQIMCRSFDAFDDVASTIWRTLLQMNSGGNLCHPARLTGTTVPLLKSEEVTKKQKSNNYPIADDIFDPVEYGWTPENYEVRQALKEYSEATHADCPEAGR